MSCLACGRYLHDECLLDPCCCRTAVTVEPTVELESNPFKEAKVLKDPLSTGRKRAVKVRTISPGDSCDWRLRKNCGGGKNPVTGCLDGVAKHIHHGPDKSTLNNEPNNLHKLCNNCHNRWHNANDWCLDPTILHNPVPASVEEVAKYDIDWSIGKYAEWTNKRREFFSKAKTSEDEEHVGHPD